ncbi:MAG: hypothetical protein Q8L78_07540 [Coxiellaceae bacterium]|nr:hypothetical protein [Coxiellaceae bacterium]
MIKRIIITGLLLGSITTSSFANQAAEDNIALACKPYLQQYAPNSDPDKLPPAAQAALIACKAHGSCATSILSDPVNGVSDCAIKLQRLQPNQKTPLVVITPQSQQAVIPVKKAAPAWYIGSPSSQPAQQPNTVTEPTPPPEKSVAAETDTVPPANTNQPLGVTPSDQKKSNSQPSINWF